MGFGEMRYTDAGGRLAGRPQRLQPYEGTDPGASVPDGAAIPHGVPDVILPRRPPGQPIFPPNCSIMIIQVKAASGEERRLWDRENNLLLAQDWSLKASGGVGQRESGSNLQSDLRTTGGGGVDPAGETSMRADTCVQISSPKYP